MAISKIILNGVPQMDLTQDTVAAGNLVYPNTAHGADGQAVTGSLQSVQQATPSISVSNSGLITASATQAAGVVAAGTQQVTQQLTTQAAQTITPSTIDQVIAGETFLTGNQTILGDANLIPANIAENVTIFGVTGTHSGGSGGGNAKVAEVNLSPIGNSYFSGELPSGWSFGDVFDRDRQELPQDLWRVFLTVRNNSSGISYYVAGINSASSTSTMIVARIYPVVAGISGTPTLTFYSTGQIYVQMSNITMAAVCLVSSV